MKFFSSDEIAAEYIAGWGRKISSSLGGTIQALPNDQINTVLLVHIAKSLRILRGENFQDIPSRLTRIETAVKNLRRKKTRRQA